MEKATLCNTDAEVCEYRAAYLVNLSLNCLTIALNIIHIILMSKLANSKKTTYFWILINMSLTDIMVSATYGVLVSCVVNRAVYKLPRSSAEYFLRTRAAMTLAITAIRNFVLAIASYERYVKICTPLEVENNKLLNHLGWSMAVIWVVCYGLTIPAYVTDIEDICFGNFTLSGKLGLQNIFVSMLLLTVPAVITFTCLFKVWRELKRIIERDAAKDGSLEAQIAGRYVLLVCLLFYFSYAPQILATILNYFRYISLDTVKVLNWVSVLSQSVYGTLNIIIYVSMTKGYRVHVLTIVSKTLRCRNILHTSESTVTPSPDM
ncbi:hypothetical protein EB796_008222 [Bugula neritina]|uniref:G-protein coupled receptors family 1 profile domain-containing protein n=1 Tax=Bugula neritina TaxID=10212 RepID=A0A7J7K4B5_BUGNE|nr:hypothetical protein EB796_008222 [Bugula neritina]